MSAFCEFPLGILERLRAVARVLSADSTAREAGGAGMLARRAISAPPAERASLTVVVAQPTPVGPQSERCVGLARGACRQAGGPRVAEPRSDCGAAGVGLLQPVGSPPERGGWGGCGCAVRLSSRIGPGARAVPPSLSPWPFRGRSGGFLQTGLGTRFLARALAIAA